MLKNIAIVLLLIIPFLFSGCISTSNDEKPYDGPLITAMEGYAIANETAHNWSEIVIFTGAMDNVHLKGGKATSWGYYFWNGSIGRNSSIGVTVWADGRVYTRYVSSDYPVNNWTIDSDEAYNIAINNTEISEFLDEKPRAKISSFVLRGWSEHMENVTSIWSIEWSSRTPFGSDFAEIEINATSGEVIYSEARYWRK